MKTNQKIKVIKALLNTDSLKGVLTFDRKVAKDSPVGHAFRGNQYTSGVGGIADNPKEHTVAVHQHQEAANAHLQEAAAHYNHAAGAIQSSGLTSTAEGHLNAAASNEKAARMHQEAADAHAGVASGPIWDTGARFKAQGLSDNAYVQSRNATASSRRAMN